MVGTAREERAFAHPTKLRRGILDCFASLAMTRGYYNLRSATLSTT